MNTPAPSPPARLVAIVVTYNRLDKLRVTLGRLLGESVDDLTAVLVVDNASDDGSADWLATQDDPRLVVQRNASNIGGAGGFEMGMRMVVAQFDPDWIVLMDDDARPDPGVLAAFNALDNRDWDAVAAAVYYPDGRICDINRPSINPFWDRAAFLRTALGAGREGFHLLPEAYQANQRRAVDAASFVGLFVCRGAIERVGYPDGRLFVYGDDVLYTLRLRAAGGRIAFDPDLRFEHDFSTIATGERRFRPLWKSYYHHRNLLMVYREVAGWLFWPALFVVLPKWLLKTRDHAGERQVFLRLMMAAIRDGVLGRTSVDHAQVVAMAAPSGSEYPDDSAPKA